MGVGARRTFNDCIERELFELILDKWNDDVAERSGTNDDGSAADESDDFFEMRCSTWC